LVISFISSKRERGQVFHRDKFVTMKDLTPLAVCHDERFDPTGCFKQITVWIAQLGGFMARKSDGDPGVTHIWRGLKKIVNLIEGAQIFQNTYG